MGGMESLKTEQAKNPPDNRNTTWAVASLILAAGRGSRMKSSLPKVLHTLAGRTMLEWVAGAIKAAGVEQSTLVLSSDLSEFDAFLARFPEFRVVIQNNRQGTGDAVAAAASSFEGISIPYFASGQLYRGSAINADRILIAAGDIPYLDATTVRSFLEATSKSDLGVLGLRPPDPFGYGRLVQNTAGHLEAIVEERDADSSTKAIGLCNSGLIVGRTELLFDLLGQTSADNKQNEYYLTDCFAVARDKGFSIDIFEAPDWQRFRGVNDRRQLAELETHLLRAIRETWMTRGVRFVLPETTMIEADVTLEADCWIGPNVSLEGTTKVGTAARIGSGCSLHNVDVGPGALIGPHSVLKDCTVATGSKVAPQTCRSE